jgi:small subunit ribosomal protein S2
MPVATRRELLEAGVHFGHQTKRWNPKMRRYLYGQRSGIYIVDLERTLDGLQVAYDFLREIGSRNGTVLFVGTKKQAQEVVAEQATRVNMPYVNTRWLGGMLTNFQTIYGRLKRLKELRDMERSGAFDFLPKKEVLKLRHEKEKLERNLAGIQDMERLPEAIFVIDTKKEHIAVTEARKLGIPVIAIVDTNCDPDEVDYVIPGNDDAIRACTVVARVVADAIQEGQYLAYQRMQRTTAEPEFEQEPEAATTRVDAAAEEDALAVRLSAEEAEWMGLGAPDADQTGAPGAPAETPEEAAAASRTPEGTREPAPEPSIEEPAPAADGAAEETPAELTATVPEVSATLAPPELNHVSEPAPEPRSGSDSASEPEPGPEAAGAPPLPDDAASIATNGPEEGPSEEGTR